MKIVRHNVRQFATSFISVVGLVMRAVKYRWRTEF